MDIDKLKSIRDAIKEKGYQWSAGKTSLSDLSEEEQKKYLGLILKDDEIKEMEAMASEEDALAADSGICYIYPRKWDWRNVYGRNWTTSVKDQGPYPTCVAFAVVGALESNLEIYKRNPYLEPNLSDADLFLGGGGDLKGGWNIPPALDYARERGIPDEACLPYSNINKPYSPCPDRNKRVVKIQNWETLYNASKAKAWISRRGPLSTTMAVYYDFFSYRGGIYNHVTGGLAGHHAVAVVGYDERNRCWICKNSWGTGWGEKGWFRIRYGECGIGTAFYAAEFPMKTDDIYLPHGGKVTVKFLSKESVYENEFWIYAPKKKLLFKATDENVGKEFDVGTLRYPNRLTFALKTPEGFTYYTRPALNPDCCDHVIKVQLNTHNWELRWEDLYGLGDRDFNDVVVKVTLHH